MNSLIKQLYLILWSWVHAIHIRARKTEPDLERITSIAEVFFLLFVFNIPSHIDSFPFQTNPHLFQKLRILIPDSINVVILWSYRSTSADREDANNEQIFLLHPHIRSHSRGWLIKMLILSSYLFVGLEFSLEWSCLHQLIIALYAYFRWSE